MIQPLKKNTAWLEGKQDDILQQQYELVMRRMESTMQVCKCLLKLMYVRRKELACCSLCQTEGAASRSLSPRSFDIHLPCTLSTEVVSIPSSGAHSPSPFC